MKEEISVSIVQNGNCVNNLLMCVNICLYTCKTMYIYIIQKGKMIKIKRKAYRVGVSSLALTIPAAVVEAYNIDIGDTLLVDIQDIIKPAMVPQG